MMAAPDASKMQPLGYTYPVPDGVLPPNRFEAMCVASDDVNWPRMASLAPTGVSVAPPRLAVSGTPTAPAVATPIGPSQAAYNQALEVERAQRIVPWGLQAPSWQVPPGQLSLSMALLIGAHVPADPVQLWQVPQLAAPQQ